MEITSRNDFAAAPDAVATMLTTKEFLEKVCEASGATSYEVTADGDHTVTRRELPTPPQAQKFAGATLTIVEDVTWSAAKADGSRDGRLDLQVPGMPVTMHGSATLKPGGKGTVVTYSGDLKVNIPFIGKKVEQQAAPAIVEALSIQQRIGDDWLKG